MGIYALFLDFDGTLIEIASGPDAIEVPGDLPQRLNKLAARMDRRLALVSGRSLDNIAEHIGPLDIARAGSHGADRLPADGPRLGEPPMPLDAAVIAALQAVSLKFDALLEQKTHGAALHFRANPESSPAIEAAASQIASEYGLDTKSGKCVIELVRTGADKGGAVRAFMDVAPFAGSVPIFIGDDVTDEDGFAAAANLGGFGIAVGERPSHNAQYTLSTVKDVHQWLSL
ncbi:trehalose-phosphatase [Pontixanthobacter sp.]|uniref:trehalose-phosphatase n=1 Tax=Pontixanthobacter sp. TaxID=2792078 RepID=UPI003C7A70BF